ncbi:MAG: HAD family hydrolase [Salibacteraceae bacterium]
MNNSWLKEIDESWTLFLDRDGVINHKLENDYVKHIDEFRFLPGVLAALELLAINFKRIVVVTNQQGIGKGLMTEQDLLKIHQYMLKEVLDNGGRIDGVYYCPGLAADNPPCRKPNTGMAFDARREFSEIEFDRSLMIGDSISDMQFGERLGMKCVRIAASDPDYLCVPNLLHIAKEITSP